MHLSFSLQIHTLNIRDLAQLSCFLLLSLPFIGRADHSASSSSTENRTAAHFASSLTDDPLSQNQIIESVLGSGVHGSHSELNDTQLQVARAGLGCYISTLIFKNVREADEDGYVDGSNTNEYTNRTEVNW